MSELLTGRLCDLHKRQNTEPMEIDLPSYSVPANLSAILRVYGLNKPPAQITTHQIFDKLIAKVNMYIQCSIHSIQYMYTVAACMTQCTPTLALIQRLGYKVLL